MGPLSLRGLAGTCCPSDLVVISQYGPITTLVPFERVTVRRRGLDSLSGLHYLAHIAHAGELAGAGNSVVAGLVVPQVVPLDTVRHAREEPEASVALAV